MALTCNIDARGRRARFVWGVLMLVAALFVGVGAWRHGGWWWVWTTLLIGMGAFGLFEARKGWCAVRAMGIKTKF